MTAFQHRVFSGVQPTGNLHLGNYLGAVSRWVPLQDQMETIFCVVDLHAITAGFPARGELQAATREVTAAYIASGIDPKKSIIFNQSQVPAHSGLAWIFNCVARIGWMNRMTQFKDKAGKNRENASLGLLAYPSLMAADILAYKATHVPVGDDQKQHLELCRDVAARFNRDFGIYYCAADESVAIAESSFHRARFLRESRIDETTQEMRVIRAQLGSTTLQDVRHLVGDAIYDPDDYGEAQTLGYTLRAANSFGIHYQSVRAKGECYGVLRPRALSDAIHWRYLRYHYDQGRIVEVESVDGSGRR